MFTKLFALIIFIGVMISLAQLLFVALLDFFAANWWWLGLLVVAFLFYLRRVATIEENRKKRKLLDAIRAREDEILRRDSDVQSEPYTYEIGRHGNETLALRYGIANTKLETTPFYYYAKGGVKTRNADRDQKKVIDAKSISLRKMKKLSKPENAYLVELTDFRERKAIAIHKNGDDFIPTFYPLDVKKNDVDEGWFDRNVELEAVLKGNRSMTLKEIAKFHIDKTVKVY